MTINIQPDGTVAMIYSDDFAGLLDQGKATVRRASHVEPDAAGGWSADMSPVGGPVLGSFRLRSDALAAEVAWIEQNVLGGAA